MEKQPFGHGSLFQHHHLSSPFAARKFIPLPASKRQRPTVDIEVETDPEPMQRSPSNSPPQRHYHQTQHQAREHIRDVSREEPRHQSETRPSASSLMNRCHVCSRKPTKKSELDGFADCQGCGQRTCYVCIRECLGWDPRALQQGTTSTQEASDPHRPTTGSTTSTTTISTPINEEGETSFTMLDADAEAYHQRPTSVPSDYQGMEREQGEGWTRGGGHRQMVCSRCCVEKGQDGDIVCLGCLPFVEG